MSQYSVIAALVFSLIIAVFALANSQPVLINYLFGKTEVSAIIVILCAAASGAFIIFLLNLVRQIKASLRIRGLRNDIKILEERVQELEKERDFFQVQAEQFRQALSDADDSGDFRDFPPGVRFKNGDVPGENIEVEERKEQI